MGEFSKKDLRQSVTAKSTIIQTMKLMDDRRTKSLLVFDNEQFIGMITNGDLQRAIIANKPFDATIDSIVDNTNKKYAHIDDDKEQIKSWMMEVRAEMMPVVDSAGNLVKVIFWNDLFDEAQKNNRAEINLPVVIMAGGKSWE